MPRGPRTPEVARGVPLSPGRGAEGFAVAETEAPEAAADRPRAAGMAASGDAPPTQTATADAADSYGFSSLPGSRTREALIIDRYPFEAGRRGEHGAVTATAVANVQRACKPVLVSIVGAMSGPKCASYSVDHAAIARQRRRDAARTRSDGLVDRLKSLQVANTARHGQGLQVVSTAGLGDFPTGGSVEQMESWNEEAESVLPRAEAELARAEQHERREDLRRRISAVASGDVAATIRRRAEEDTRRAETSRSSPSAECSEPAGEVVDRSAVIAALVDRYPAGASSEERAFIDERMLTLTGTSDVEFSSAAIGVKAEIQRVERRIADRAETARRAEGLLATLEGLAGAQVDASQDLLRRVIAGETPLLASDVAAVARAREEASADYERRFVASSIEDAFRECGFEVGGEFTSDVVGGEETYFASRSSGDHAVGVRMRDGLVDLRVVRGEGAPDVRRDADAEVEFCKDLGRVSAELHRRGVDLELVSQVSPGDEPMAVVSGARSALHARTSAASLARPQQRSRTR